MIGKPNESAETSSPRPRRLRLRKPPAGANPQPLTPHLFKRIQYQMSESSSGTVTMDRAVLTATPREASTLSA